MSCRRRRPDGIWKSPDRMHRCTGNPAVSLLQPSEELSPPVNSDRFSSLPIRHRRVSCLPGLPAGMSCRLRLPPELLVPEAQGPRNGGRDRGMSHFPAGLSLLPQCSFLRSRRFWNISGCPRTREGGRCCTPQCRSIVRRAVVYCP